MQEKAWMEMALIKAESNMNVRSMLCEVLLDTSPLLLKSGLYLLLPVLTCSHSFLWHKHQFDIFLNVVKSQHHSPTISNFCRNDHLIFSKEIGLTMIIYAAMFSNCDSHPSLNVGCEKFIGVEPVSLADGTAWVLLVNLLLYLACCLPIATVVWCSCCCFKAQKA
jgi:hypothetical protein